MKQYLFFLVLIQIFSCTSKVEEKKNIKDEYLSRTTQEIIKTPIGNSISKRPSSFDYIDKLQYKISNEKALKYFKIDTNIFNAVYIDTFFKYNDFDIYSICEMCLGGGNCLVNRFYILHEDSLISKNSICVVFEDGYESEIGYWIFSSDSSIIVKKIFQFRDLNFQDSIEIEIDSTMFLRDFFD